MGKVQTHPFEIVALPLGRQQKPRNCGLTMMMDWGVGLRRIEDHLELVAPYVDLAKIAVGTARLYSRKYLMKKLELFKKFDIAPFLGGQFTEYVYATQGRAAIKPFFQEAKSLGFSAVEISDNCVPLNNEEREELIKAAIDCGMKAHGEVGSKIKHQTADVLIEQANVSLLAGCDHVLVEGAELVNPDGSPNQDIIGALKDRLPLEKVLFELTGPWIKGTSLWNVYQLKKLLVAEFGININLANVMPEDVLETEALRVGLSVAGPDFRGDGTLRGT